LYSSNSKGQKSCPLKVKMWFMEVLIAIKDSYMLS
jgi:hypothetical protein